MQYIFKHFFELQMVSRFGHYTSTWMFNTDNNLFGGLQYSYWDMNVTE